MTRTIPQKEWVTRTMTKVAKEWVKKVTKVMTGVTKVTRTRTTTEVVAKEWVKKVTKVMTGVTNVTRTRTMTKVAILTRTMTTEKKGGV